MKGRKRTAEENQEIVRKVQDYYNSHDVDYTKACSAVGVDYSVFHRAKGVVHKIDPAREIVRVDKSTEKMLKAENFRLKTIVAELMLDLSALKEYQAR